MKKIVIIVLSILFSSSLFAQNSYTNEDIEKADKMTQQMKAELNLNESQTAELQAINLEVVKRMKSAETISNTDSLQKAVQIINVYRDSELKKILTPQQYANLLTNVKGRNCH
jgi:hypothetical protein